MACFGTAGAAKHPVRFLTTTRSCGNHGFHRPWHKCRARSRSHAGRGASSGRSQHRGTRHSRGGRHQQPSDDVDGILQGLEGPVAGRVEGGTRNQAAVIARSARALEPLGRSAATLSGRWQVYLNSPSRGGGLCSGIAARPRILGLGPTRSISNWPTIAWFVDFESSDVLACHPRLPPKSST